MSDEVFRNQSQELYNKLYDLLCKENSISKALIVTTLMMLTSNAFSVYINNIDINEREKMLDMFLASMKEMINKGVDILSKDKG